ncbi:TPA: hypothetical protein ACSTL5_004995 [Serratia fonticola]
MNETNHPSPLVTCTLIQDFLGVKDGGIYEAVVKQKQQLDAVVAECAAQKSIIDAVVAVANQSQGISGWHLNGDVAGWGEILPEIYDIETPNVTSALAEVEAKAIDKAIECITSVMMHPEVSQVVNTLKMFVDVLEAFKKELLEAR